VAQGGWKQKLGWGFIALFTIGILLAATWRAWTPNAIRWGLEFRGISVAKVRWDGTNSLEFSGVQYERDGFLARAKTVTVLTPPAWKRALRSGDTNQTYLTVNGWRVILPQASGAGNPTGANSIAEKVRTFNDQIHRFESQCPRALILNGTLQTAKGEFNFGVVEWKGGELSGNFTWPQLNDPADFKLKIVDATKLQLIVKQIALEIGSRDTVEVLHDGARLAGYARWKANRVDYDVTFPFSGNVPRFASVDSKGLSIPGDLIGMPDVEALNARGRLVVTNGQFNLAVGAAPAAESGSESGGEGH
jgi:hypothetical protein